MAESKRKLPVFKPTEDEDEEARPPWQWAGFGTAAMFGIWLPLAYLAEALKARALSATFGDSKTPEEIAAAYQSLDAWQVRRVKVIVVLSLIVPLASAAFGGGYLVGRWGKGAGPREAALAASMTMLIAVGLTCAQAGATWQALIPLLVAVPLAAFGGAIGVRRRARVHGPNA